jgi:putative transferase (TIGR04331 family)
MFLATTADQKFWKQDEPILFLGEWCRVYSQKHLWSELEHKVLPYHGRDRNALYNDYKYAMDIYERTLVQLAGKLNALHGLNHSVRFWRIILGPWLVYFIQILLDRYRSISIAIDSGKVTNTWITAEFPEECLSNDFAEFRARSFQDGYNHFLYSQIIKSSGAIPWKTKTNADALTFESKGAFIPQRNGFKWALIRLLGACSSYIPDSLQKMVAHQSYIKPMDLARLQLSMNMIPCPYGPQVDTVPSKVDWEMRQSIKQERRENQFESILEEFIPLHIPRVYMEGFSRMTQKAMDVFPKNPKIILTSIACKMDEGFKFWAAGQVERGVKLAVTQHGGHIGDGLWSTDDDHEVKIADRYFTWGWTRENESKIMPMSSSMLGTAKDLQPDPSGSILCVPGTFPRYPIQMFSVPQGPVVIEDFKLQGRFVKATSLQARNLLVMRLFMHSYGWGEKLRWRDLDVTLKVYQGNKSYHDHLSISRLCICFYNGTPLLEAFAANFPTLLCWDPKYTELNELSQFYFDLLRKAEILHDTPETLASKLNEIYEDPMSWWMSSGTQDAKNKFCRRFARTSDDWVVQWKEELMKLIHED